MNAASVYAEAAFVLAVTAGAMIYPPLALAIAAAFLVALAVVIDRRSTPAAEGSDAGGSEEKA